MIGGGTAASMNSTIKNNRSLLKKRKSLKEIANDLKHPPGKKRIYHYKNASSQQLKNIRERLMSRNLRLLKLKILVFTLIFCTGVILITSLLLLKT